ncbi:MAG: YCF48-related protein [Parcubacteria group bacterium]|jgi:photosystem II stability/assembly factor-like uncharacterized protein
MKKVVILIFCLSLTLVFSACSLSSSTSTSSTSTTKQVGSFLKSFDGGKNWENKVKIDDKTNVGTYNVLSMEASSKDGGVVYIGTEKNGLFVTRNDAENWEKLVFPLAKIYGLAVDKNNDQTIYASGVLNSRAKIYKSINGGKDWVEIYTEPANGSIISSLEISNKNSSVLYSGTSEGMIFKTSDGGQTWKNIFKASAPVISIAFDAVNDDAIYFGVYNSGLLRTLDGGNNVEDINKINIGKADNKSLFSKLNVYSIEIDPKNSGSFYVGTKSGLFRGSDFGSKFEEINILESSKEFPIRAIAINPQNSNEIIYSNSGVIYRSTDGGTTWLTFQLNTDKVAQVLRYNLFNANTIYIGLRKI